MASPFLPASPLTWQPAEGDVIHFRALSLRGLPTGRYRLERQGGDFNSSFWLRGLTNGKLGAESADTLAQLERDGRVTLIPPSELDRERQMMQLRTVGPLRGRGRSQRDVDGLGLFDHARSPAMI